MCWVLVGERGGTFGAGWWGLQSGGAPGGEAECGAAAGKVSRRGSADPQGGGPELVAAAWL